MTRDEDVMPEMINIMGSWRIVFVKVTDVMKTKHCRVKMNGFLATY